MSTLRELTPELAKVAKDELGEVPDRMPADLQAIKEWLAKQSHITARTDDQWLIAFLRGCKYSLERTKEKLDNYHTMKTMVPEFSRAVDPMDPGVQQMIKLGISLILPKTAGPTGPRVIIIRSGVYDPSQFSMLDTMSLNNMISAMLMMTDDNTVIAGQRYIIDMKNVTMAHLSQMTPATVKKMVMTGQESLPIREKGTHLINTPMGIETLFNLFKSFMNDKGKNRVHMHNEDMEALHKFVPKEILPTEYGGDGGSVQEIIDHWKAKMESRRDWFIENGAHKTDESKRPGKPKTVETMFGIEGSFRRLNVD